MSGPYVRRLKHFQGLQNKKNNKNILCETMHKEIVLQAEIQFSTDLKFMCRRPLTSR